MRQREVYAIHGGDYLGEMWVFMEEKQKLHFLAIPKMEIRSVDVDVFDVGVEIDVVRYVQDIEPDVFDICHRQYLHAKEQTVESDK